MRLPFTRSELTAHLGIFAAAMLIALASAGRRPEGANDSSQLAAVECLVDYRTFAIDDSVFATVDKAFIHGHFYSTRPPLPTLLLAAAYQTMQWAVGLKAGADPGRFAYAMTVAGSGVAYALALCCCFALGGRLGLSLGWRIGLTAWFGLGTLALPYVRAVNAHILLLAVAMAIVLWLPQLCERHELRRWHVLSLGGLAGFGSTLDLGTGPVLLLCTAGLVVYRLRRISALAGFALGALPWLTLHHAINYDIGGTWKPYSAVPEYFQYEHSSFDAASLTGVLNKHTPGTFVVYAVRMMADRYGFLNCNILVVLAVVSGVVLVRRKAAETPEVLFAGTWFVGTWLLYALGSSNYGGRCLSIRWFVPLLAAAWYVLAVGLRRVTELGRPCRILGGWGIAAGPALWWAGPWLSHNVSFLWALFPAALLHCWVDRKWVQKLRSPPGKTAVPKLFARSELAR
jgi:hypothetical protein